MDTEPIKESINPKKICRGCGHTFDSHKLLLWGNEKNLWAICVHGTKVNGKDMLKCKCMKFKRVRSSL